MTSETGLPRGFLCACCNEWHDELLLDLGFRAPAGWNDDYRETKQGRSLTSDVCIIVDHDGTTDRFIRGVLPIPIRGTGRELCYGTWSSLSEQSYARYQELWDSDPAPDEPSWFGWFASALPYAPPTLSLKVDVMPQPQNQRPRFTLQPTDHPLAVEQREGTTVERLIEILSPLMH